MKLIWDLEDLQTLPEGQVLIDIVFPETLYFVEHLADGETILHDIHSQYPLEKVPSLGLQVVAGFAFDYYAGVFDFDPSVCSLTTVNEMMTLATPKEQAIGARKVYYAYLVAREDKLLLRIPPLMLRGEESLITFCSKYGIYCKEIIIKNSSKSKILFVYKNGRLYSL